MAIPKVEFVRYPECPICDETLDPETVLLRIGDERYVVCSDCARATKNILQLLGIVYEDDDC